MKSSLNLQKPGFTLKNIKTQPFLRGEISLADVSAAYGINAFHLMEYLVTTTINNGGQMCDNQSDVWARYVKKYNLKEDLVIPSYSLSIPGSACFFLYDHKEKTWSKNYFDPIDGFPSSIRVGYFTTPMSTN